MKSGTPSKNQLLFTQMNAFSIKEKLIHKLPEIIAFFFHLTAEFVVVEEWTSFNDQNVYVGQTEPQ